MIACEVDVPRFLLVVRNSFRTLRLVVSTHSKEGAITKGRVGIERGSGDP